MPSPPGHDVPHEPYQAIAGLEILPLSYQKKVWLALPSHAFFWYDTDYRIVIVFTDYIFLTVTIILNYFFLL